jgi:hypothetical protein
VFYLILILLVVWFVLIVLLAAWTLWFQAYIYSEPVGEIWWRAPAAGTAVAVFVCLWVVLDYGTDGRYRPLHEFSAREADIYSDLWVVNQDGKEDHYMRGADNQYRNKNGKGLPTRPNKIIASQTKDGDKQVFEPERDEKGRFKVEKNAALRYYEKDNPKRYMEETALGQVSVFHFGWLVMNLVLNFVLLAVWWVALWLLLRFQWSHALGLAVVFWGVMLLFVLPPVLTYAENVARQRATARSVAHVGVNPTPGWAGRPR